jgi:hypothetical protein
MEVKGKKVTTSTTTTEIKTPATPATPAATVAPTKPKTSTEYKKSFCKADYIMKALMNGGTVEAIATRVSKQTKASIKLLKNQVTGALRNVKTKNGKRWSKFQVVQKGNIFKLVAKKAPVAKKNHS